MIQLENVLIGSKKNEEMKLMAGITVVDLRHPGAPCTDRGKSCTDRPQGAGAAKFPFLCKICSYIDNYNLINHAYKRSKTNSFIVVLILLSIVFCMCELSKKEK